MSKLKISVVFMLLCSIFVLSMNGCASDAGSESAEVTTSPVTRGDIVVEVTGTGNLAFKKTQNLVFGQTGEASETVNVLVSSVNVTEGDYVETGQVLVEADTKDWQDRITELEHAVEEAEYNLLQAQANLNTAEYNLSAQEDVKEIQDKIDTATEKYNAAQVYYRASLKENSVLDKEYWLEEMMYYEEQIAEYEKEKNELLEDPEHSGAASSVANLEKLIMSVNQAEYAVQNAENQVEEAKTDLENERSSSQQITAPFDGVITSVNVSEDDIVSRTQTLIELADPNAFLADILVSEVDIFSIEEGGYAEVTVDALDDYVFPAVVYQIDPVANVASGVVNYGVVVELTSLEPVGSNEAQSLKQGLSVTVNVVVDEAKDVLMVPSRAVTSMGRDSIVQVLEGDEIVQRVVETGLTNSSNTEVISGLEQGEQVVVSSSSSTTLNSNNGGGGLMGIGGAMGGGPPDGGPPAGQP